MDPSLQVLLATAFHRVLGRPVDEIRLAGFAREQAQRFLVHFDDPANANDPRTIAAMLGVSRYQHLFYRADSDVVTAIRQASRPETSEMPDPQLRAYLEMLGALAVNSAVELLPAELKALREEWIAAGKKADLQITVCERLLAALSSEKPAVISADVEKNLETLWLDDFLDQDPARIFPRGFLGAEGGRPNCLGKGIVLTGFFHSLHVKVLGVTPIQPYHEFAEKTLDALCELIAEIAKKKEIELTDKFKEAILLRTRAAKARENYPDRFHMAVLVPLADGRWYLIDPHLRCGGLIAGHYEAGFAADLFQFLSDALPGAVLLHTEGLAAEALRKDACMAVGEPIDWAQRILAKWGEYAHLAGAVIPLVAQPNFLELLLEAKLCPPGRSEELLATLKKGADKHSVSSILDASGVRRHMNFHVPGGREIGATEQNRYQVANIVLDTVTGGELFAAYSSQARNQNVIDDGMGGCDLCAKDIEEPPTIDEALCEGLERILAILHTMAYRKAIDKLSYGVAAIGKPHPLFELYEPSFRIAVELVAHLNAIGESSNEVVMALAKQCGGQHHVLLAATEPLRTGQGVLSPTAAAAAKLLQVMPAVLPAAREGLAQLQQAGLITMKGRHDEPKETPGPEERGVLETHAIV